ncbi:MAG: hypothetical protein Q9161_008169 [Pseudevernia consocians]
MFFTSLLVSALAIGNTSTSSLPERVSAPIVDDGIILNFALTLEFLQRDFYEGALSQFTQADVVAAGFEDPFYADLQAVFFDEQSHVAFLILALLAAGIEPTNELEYEFPYTDVASFVDLASIIEGVSVSAYLGALSSIEDVDYLTAFGAILGVEARQSSYIRAGLGEAPFPNPFDTPLGFVSLSHAHPAGLSPITFSDAFSNAEKVGVTKDTTVYAVFISGLLKMPVVARITNDSSDYTVDEIPNGVSGQVYVVLSASGVDFADDHTIAGPAVLEASFHDALHGTFLSGCAGLMTVSGVPDWSGAVDASCGMPGGVCALRDPVSVVLAKVEVEENWRGGITVVAESHRLRLVRK